MNKTMRIVVICGGLAIILLAAIFYFLSKKTNYEVEKSLNNALEDLANSVSLGNNPIDRVDYSPFECDGIRDYTCKSSEITFRINGIKDIKFSNVKLEMRDIPNRKHVFFKLNTSIDYIDNNAKDRNDLNRLSVGKLHGLSIMPMSDIMSSISVLLPNKISCEQDYNYKDSNPSKDIDIKTNCDFFSNIFNMNFKLENIINAKIDNPHVLGAIYDILRAISNVESDYKTINIDQISHTIKDMSITLNSQIGLDDYLQSQESLSEQQRDKLKNYILSFKTLGNFALENANLSYKGAKYHLSFLLDNAYKIITKDIDTLTMSVTPREEQRVDSMREFLSLGSASIPDWMSYLDKYYNIAYHIDGKPHANVAKTPKDSKEDSKNKDINTKDLAPSNDSSMDIRTNENPQGEMNDILSSDKI